MKISLSSALIATYGVCLTMGFSPLPSNNAIIVSPFQSSSKVEMASPKKSDSLDEEVERMVQEDIEKKKKYSNLRNTNGVEYAPWMGISREEEDKIRQIMREKAEARRKRQLQEQDVRGALLVDSQAQELSGTGLNAKVVDGNSVELEWATSSEKSTRGFLIKRRQAKSSDKNFQIIASYENYGPLASKGPEGGVYRYLDEDLEVGGYFYRVTEKEKNGAENDLSQCLVEIQTADEKRGVLLAAVGVVTLLIAAIVGGVVLDPMQ